MAEIKLAESMLWSFAYALALYKKDTEAQNALLPPPPDAVQALAACLLGILGAFANTRNLPLEEALIKIQAELVKIS